MAGTNKVRYPSFDFLLTGARFVLGSLTEKQTKDQQGRDRANPILFTAFAVDKRTPGVGQHIDNIIGYARHTYGFVPNGQQVAARLQHVNFASKSGFAWKLKDGDTDPAWMNREGCKGCWIFLCQTSLDTIRCYDANNVQLDPKAINLGDYCDVFIGTTVNGETGDTAGLYLNPNGVRLQWKGQRIIPAGQSPDQMFGAAGQGAQPIGYQPPSAQPMPGQPPQQGYGAPAGYQPPTAQPMPQQGYGAPAGYQPPQEHPQPQGYQQPAQPGYMPPPSPTPAPQGHYAPPAAQPQGNPGAPQYPQHSGGYPQPAGPQTTPMPYGGGAPTAYPTSPAPNGYPAAPGQPASYPQPAPAYAQAAPAGAPQGGYAPSVAQPSYPATAYPTNQGFVQGPR